ncbi:hypothetical protein GF376_03145 [Candidatus Peregrinibacteria bacterium]|nr:hypothetical protein [Candidatus Peregrinibacteria bacterium]
MEQPVAKAEAMVPVVMVAWLECLVEPVAQLAEQPVTKAVAPAQAMLSVKATRTVTPDFPASVEQGFAALMVALATSSLTQWNSLNFAGEEMAVPVAQVV